MFKEFFGLNAGEPIEPVMANIQHGEVLLPVVILSEPSSPIVGDIGADYVAVFAQQYNGFWSLMQVHISQIIEKP